MLEERLAASRNEESVLQFGLTRAQPPELRMLPALWGCAEKSSKQHATEIGPAYDEAY